MRTLTRIAAPSVLVAVLATACGPSEPADFDFATFADAIDDTIDDADFDEDTQAEIDCPVDDWDDIVEASLSDIDDDVVEVALDGERTEFAYRFGPGDNIECAYGAEEGTELSGLFMLEAPRDADRFTEEFGGDDARVDIDDTNEYRGGQFRQVCVEFDEEDRYPYCQVEWLDDDVLVGIFVFGEDADRIDLDDLEAAFTLQLDLIAEQFEE